MTRDVVCFDCRDSVADLVAGFRDNHFRRVSVFRHGKLAGTIRRRDMIK